MVKLGQMMTGGDAGNRQADDFYSTPPDCTRALLHAERLHVRRFSRIWEPACGTGAICDVLSDFNFEFFASDLVNRGYAWQEDTIDFLRYPAKLCDAIITNPPFNIAENFISHSFAIGVDYLALLLKSTFWHAAKRGPLFRMWPPARIYAMTWRPDFLLKGAPTMDCMWCVWDRSDTGPTEYHLLERP